jgi:hypothetical protein
MKINLAQKTDIILHNDFYIFRHEKSVNQLILIYRVISDLRLKKYYLHNVSHVIKTGEKPSVNHG